MTGSFKLKEINPSGLGVIQTLLNRSPQFNLGFGGNGRSAFIDNNTFAAIEKSGSTVVEAVQLGISWSPNHDVIRHPPTCRALS